MYVRSRVMVLSSALIVSQHILVTMIKKLIGVTLFLCASHAYSADTVLHGMQGFALHFGLAKMSTNDTTSWYVAGISGFVLGALPDLADYLSHEFVGTPRWNLYTSFHHGSVAQTMKYFPAYGLHLAIDALFHSGPYEQHWGKDWRLVVFDAVLWVVTLYVLEKLLE